MKKVLLNGAEGKMGKAITRLIETNPQWGLSVAVKRESGQKVIGDFDIVIDFSTPQGAQEAFTIAHKHRRPFLTGTTNLPETFLFQMQAEEKIPVFYAPNVSLSVYFFTELVRLAGKMFPQYSAALAAQPKLWPTESACHMRPLLTNGLAKRWARTRLSLFPPLMKLRSRTRPKTGTCLPNRLYR